MEKFTQLAKSFTLPLAVTTVTNLTSDVGMMRQPENLGLVKVLFFYDFMLVTGHGPNCLPSFQNFSFQSCTLRSGFSKYLVNCQDSMPILLADISTTKKSKYFTT